MSDGTRALLTLLREHNVRRAEFLDGALASVEFHAPELPAPRLASLPTEGKAEDVCACGHTYTAPQRGTESASILALWHTASHQTPNGRLRKALP
jgi:hypothetical protein